MTAITRPFGAGRAWPGAVVWLAAAAIVAVHLGIHAAKWPDFSGWWAGFDQAAYLESARGWAAGDLSPGRHHYPSAHALLAAPFVGGLAAQPFIVPDLACHLATLAGMVAMARRLLPGAGWAPAAGAVACLIGTLSTRTLAAIWVVPWSTTPAAPLLIWGVWWGMRFLAGRRPADAFAAASFAGAAGLFRPVDAAVVLGCIGIVFAAEALLRRWPVRAMLGGGAAAAAGVALPATIGWGLHRAVHGAEPGAYLTISGAIGFEPSLVPLRWVVLGLDGTGVVGPAAGLGLVFAFPWVLPGLAGLVALAAAHRTRAAALPLAAVAASWVAYLAYRDLQAVSLWQFYNVHYFKWSLPVLALGAVALVRELASPGRARRVAVAATGAALLLVPWRAGVDAAGPAIATGRRDAEGWVRLDLDSGMRPPRDALLVRTDGAWTAGPGSAGRLVASDEGEGTMTVAVHPLGDVALVLPLRPTGAGAATLRLAPVIPTRLPPEIRRARVWVRPGLPWGG